MSHTGKQHSKGKSSKHNPNLVPEPMQGTEDTQSEFSVNALREERRDQESQTEEQIANSPPSTESNVAETQSEFSVNERLRGKT